MESRLRRRCRWCGGPLTPPPGWLLPPPPKLSVMNEAGSLMELCLCHCCGGPPPPAWHDNVMDGWGARPLR